MALSRPRIVIVGGGIGGLFAANASLASAMSAQNREQEACDGNHGRNWIEGR